MVVLYLVVGLCGLFISAYACAFSICSSSVLSGPSADLHHMVCCALKSSARILGIRHARIYVKFVSPIKQYIL